MSNYIVDMMNERIDLDARTPVRAPETEHIPPSAFEGRDCTAVYWLGGGGFLVNARGTVLLVDPVLETRPGEPLVSCGGQKLLLPLPLGTGEVARCDRVLYTHDDWDHACPDTARGLAGRDTPMLGSARVFETLVKQGVKPGGFTVCHAGEAYEEGGVRIEVIPGDHPWQLIDEEAYGRPFYPEECVGYVVRTPDGGILFTGDTRLLPQHFHHPGITLLPLDVSRCVFHLGRPSAALLANRYPQAHLLPYHYGTMDFPECPGQEGGDPELVLRNVNGGRERAHVVAPGHPVILREGRVE